MAKVVLGNFAIDTQQGSIAITNAAIGTEIEDLHGSRFFNRVWRETPMPQTVDGRCRKEVWDLTGEELSDFGWKELIEGLEDE